jgi:hypothetical protein
VVRGERIAEERREAVRYSVAGAVLGPHVSRHGQFYHCRSRPAAGS